MHLYIILFYDMSYQLRQWMMPAQYYDIYDLVSDMYRGAENIYFFFSGNHKFAHWV